LSSAELLHSSIAFIVGDWYGYVSCRMRTSFIDLLKFFDDDDENRKITVKPVLIKLSGRERILKVTNNGTA
jgi:hypothetical protein